MLVRVMVHRASYGETKQANEIRCDKLSAKNRMNEKLKLGGEKLKSFNSPAAPPSLKPLHCKGLRVARVTGLEPATSGVTGRHSNQLSYTRLTSTGQPCSSLVGWIRGSPPGVKRGRTA
jgi:hypothetical protein